MYSPQTRYAKTADGVHIAYQVAGEGVVDLVFVMGWTSNIEAMWEEPNLARFLRRLASSCRLILFDKRGVGLSDRVPEQNLPSLETRMDDLRAVMDAVGADRAIVLGVSEGGPLAMLFAATYPRRVAGLVLFGPQREAGHREPHGSGANFRRDSTTSTACGGRLSTRVNRYASGERQAVLTIAP